ncbi:MAG: TlpA family protein disulfide reductase [Flavobacterium sp.]
MKKILAFVIILVNISCSQAQKTNFSSVALNETLLSIDNEQVAFKEVLKKHKGKTVVIELWASWCGDCVKAMPKLKDLQRSHPEVAYVFISMDKTADKWKQGIDKHEMKGDHYMANDQMKGVFAKAIDLDWIPRYIILDKKGKIVLYRAIETDFALLDQTLNSLN